MLCEVCQENTAWVRCLECAIPLCKDCVKTDLFGTGCGNVAPIYMCRTCFRNSWLPPSIPVDSYNPF